MENLTEDIVDSETKDGDLGLGALVRALEPSVDALEIADLEGNIAYVNGSWSRLGPCARRWRRIYRSKEFVEKMH